MSSLLNSTKTPNTSNTISPGAPPSAEMSDLTKTLLVVDDEPKADHKIDFLGRR